MLRIVKIVFLFFTISCYSQNKTYFFNQDNNSITKKEFNSSSDFLFVKMKAKNDTAEIRYLVNRTHTGKLTSDQKIQFFNLFEKIIESKIDTSKNTIIHLYEENNKLLKKAIKYKKYWSWIDKNPNKINAFIISIPESKMKSDPKDHFCIDNYGIIRRLFFKSSLLKINHVVIKPDGTFTVYYGNLDILMILDSAV